MPTSRRRRTAALVVLITAALVVQGGGVGNVATAAPATGPLSSCPASASWHWGPFLWQPPWALAAPATIMMADGGAQPVGIVTPSTVQGVFTGSSGLSWSPDGTALVYRQTTQRAPFDQPVTDLVVANWDGSSPVALQGSRVVWSPMSDRVASWGDDGTIGSIARRTPTGWIVAPGPALVRDVAWSSDGLLLAWSDTGGLVHVGDPDGQHARVVGSAATADSPVTFEPHTHLVRIAGPEWFDADLDAVAGAAPRGTLSPAGDWSAWPADTDWGGLLISHNGAPPLVIASHASFVISSRVWSPDGRYLVTDIYERVGAGLRRAPLLFDTTTATAAVLGPWQQWNGDGGGPLFFSPATFDWSADSSSFFAAEQVFSQAGDVDGQMRLFRYGVDGSRTLVYDWQYNVGATFWPRTTAVTRLDLSAHFDPIATDGTTQLHIIVANDGPCDAADVVVSIATPAGSPGVSINAVQTLTFGTIPRGQRAERVVTVVPEQDLPLTLAVSTSTADEGRNTGPLTLSLPQAPSPTTSTAPPPPTTIAPAGLPSASARPAAVAVPVGASPTFTG